MAVVDGEARTDVGYCVEHIASWVHRPLAFWLDMNEGYLDIDTVPEDFLPCGQVGAKAIIVAKHDQHNVLVSIIFVIQLFEVSPEDSDGLMGAGAHIRI